MNRSENKPYELIKACFKEMFLSMPLEKITVLELCARADVSRKTFYAYFRCKDDVIEKIFYDDVVKPIGTLEPLLASSDTAVSSGVLGEKLYSGIYENREFYKQFARPNREHLLIRIVTKNLLQLHSELFQTSDRMPMEFEYSSQFIAYAQAGCIVRWLRNGTDVPPHDLASWFSTWAEPASLTMTNRAT